jgi:hypothetical protein
MKNCNIYCSCPDFWSLLKMERKITSRWWFRSRETFELLMKSWHWQNFGLSVVSCFLSGLKDTEREICLWNGQRKLVDQLLEGQHTWTLSKISFHRLLSEWYKNLLHLQVKKSLLNATRGTRGEKVRWTSDWKGEDWRMPWCHVMSVGLLKDLGFSLTFFLDIPLKILDASKS